MSFLFNFLKIISEKKQKFTNKQNKLAILLKKCKTGHFK